MKSMRLSGWTMSGIAKAINAQSESANAGNGRARHLGWAFSD